MTTRAKPKPMRPQKAAFAVLNQHGNLIVMNAQLPVFWLRSVAEQKANQVVGASRIVRVRVVADTLPGRKGGKR